jgi:spermidine/putrescine transport system ATP-binding protein
MGRIPRSQARALWRDPEQGRTDIVTVTAICIQGVSKAFGKMDDPNTVRALNNVSVAIRENEFFTLLGPSGCGKTTLLRLIAGFEFPSDGRILLYGDDIGSLPPYKRPVNTVFQNYALFPHMTVAQNIGFGLEMLGTSKSEIDTRVSEMLALVQMNELRDRKTSQISGGQQQRVALARALAPRPKVLLLDEPLSALDYKLRKDMQLELKRMQSETGITFIFVTHDQEEALTMSDRIAVMNKGEILQVGTAHEIYERPARRFVADFIGETNVLRGTASLVAGDRVKVALHAGGEVVTDSVENLPTQGEVSVVLRPEQISLSSTGSLKGEVANIVYFGTDTNVHISLKDGTHLILRHQNAGHAKPLPKVGETVAIAIAPGAARLIGDD